MKLATLKDGTRDGQLIVVSRDLQTAAIADAIVPTLQRALEDWHFYAPQLRTLYESLNGGRVRRAFKFDAKACMAPLPRAWRCIDATYPVEAQAGGEWFSVRRADVLGGAREDILIADETRQLTLRSGVAALLSDIGAGAAPMEAVASVRLLTLFASFRSPVSAAATSTPAFGAQSVSAPFDAMAYDALAFAAVAVTPDVFGDDWHHGVLRRRIDMKLNGQRLNDGTTEKSGKSSAAAAKAIQDSAAAEESERASDANEDDAVGEIRAGDVDKAGRLQGAAASGAARGADAVRVRADIGGFSTVNALLAREHAICAGTIVLGSPGFAFPDSRLLAVGDRVAVDLRDDRGTSYCGPIETSIAPRTSDS